MTTEQQLKVTKLPPAYPDGSEASWKPWKVKTPWAVRSHTGIHRMGYNVETELGSTRHCELLDAGGSLDPDTWGAPYTDAPIATIEIDETRKRGYHTRTRGAAIDREVEP